MRSKKDFADPESPDGPATVEHNPDRLHQSTIRELLAPRLREFEDVLPPPRSEPSQSPQSESPATQITSAKFPTAASGSAAAATIAAVVGLGFVAILNLLVPALTRLGIADLLFARDVPINVPLSLCLAVWLFTWVALHAAWRTRAFSRAKLYGWSTAVLLLSMLLLVPNVYRMFE